MSAVFCGLSHGALKGLLLQSVTFGQTLGVIGKSRSGVCPNTDHIKDDTIATDGAN